MSHAPVQKHVFHPGGGIPNSPLPLLFWKGRLPAAAQNGDGATRLYERNGWRGTWVYTVYTYWHFHTRGHEVLGCVSGRALIGLGGEQGITIEVERGDVCIIPAGVGHRRVEASTDFQMAGGYPPGQEGNIVEPGQMEEDRIAREIAALALPETDPISGEADGVVAIWRGSAAAARS